MNPYHILSLLIILLSIFTSCTKAIIDEGEPEIPIDVMVKYEPDVRNIMFNHCITCHGGPAPSGDFKLTTYEEVRFYAENGTLLKRMNDPTAPMPPSGLLSPTQKGFIAKWIEDGYLE